MKTWLTVLCLVLAGCGSSSDSSSEPEESTGVFDPMVESLDKAKALDDVALKQKEDMDDALRRLEGESDEAER